MYWRSRCPSVEQPCSERSGKDYIARTRMPVVIKEERVIHEEQGSMYDNWYKHNFPGGNHHGYRALEAQKKVHFAESDKTPEVGRNSKYEVTEKVDNHKSNMYGNPYKYNFPSGYRAPEAQKKAHFAECDKTSEVGRNGKYEVTEKVDNHNSNMYGNPYKYNFPSGYRAPEAQKKAHFVESDKTSEVGRKGRQEVTEEKVDNEADSFIKRKHKNFELAKMDTFKVH